MEHKPQDAQQAGNKLSEGLSEILGIARNAYNEKLKSTKPEDMPEVQKIIRDNDILGKFSEVDKLSEMLKNGFNQSK